MWKLTQRIGVKLLKVHYSDVIVRKYSNYFTRRNNTIIPLLSGFALGFCFMNSNYNVSCDAEVLRENDTVSEKEKLTLYQYATCPFCCKVRTMLDFYDINYEVVEVNPVSRKEIKFSEYRKVPILKAGETQINDSSVIISLLKTHLLGKGDIEELLSYYPVLESEEKRKKVLEYQNRYNVMYRVALSDEQHKLVKDEAKWRRWVDDTFIHTLSPNIYRTMNESLNAMEYITHVGNFSSFERSLVYYTGAVAMYVIGKRLKKRYKLKDDVRESMYEETRVWLKRLGKKKKFVGGDRPNLADLNMYGVIHAIEGLDAFDDLMKNTNISPWYKRMKVQVESHAGVKDKDWLLDK